MFLCFFLQAMDKMQLSYGYKVIRKPHPEKSLKMRDRFILKADVNGAKVSPKVRFGLLKFME